MTKNITVKYETAPGTKVDGGYFVPDIYVNVKRKGFIGWLLRLFGCARGYEEKKMYEALLSEQVSLGRAVHIPRGTITLEIQGETYEFLQGSDGLEIFLEGKFKQEQND